MVIEINQNNIVKFSFLKKHPMQSLYYLIFGDWVEECNLTFLSLTLPCQCDIWLLLFLNLHNNTPPPKLILLENHTLSHQIVNYPFANASCKTDCISISDCSLRSDTCFSNASIMAMSLSTRSTIACCSARGGRGKINSLNFVAFIFD